VANERFWGQLVPLLEERRVIPVVGRDLLRVNVDGECVDLYTVLAQRVARALELPGEPPATIDELACRHVRERRALEDIYPAIKQELGALEQGPLPDALVKLAEIDWFKLYVSTTFDNMLWRAVDTVRHQGKLTHQLSYGLNNDFEDLPDELEELQRPAIYQLLGRASAREHSYVVTDEDLLEFVHNLQIIEQQPRRLFQALARNHVLLIGGRFSPWAIRFLVRAVKHPERLWLMRGKAGFVVDDSASQDAGFREFLVHYNDRTLVYDRGDAVAFVHELWTRWKQGSGKGRVAEMDRTSPARETRISSTPRRAVFLSYASEDRAIVERIKSQLDSSGIDAWFDVAELKGGQTWKEVIAADIDSAAVFVPIISKSVLRQGAREFRAEWECSLEARKRRTRLPNGTPAPFIVPAIVDNTDMQTPGIRQYFGAIQGFAVPGAVLTDDFLKRLNELVRDARAADWR